MPIFHNQIVKELPALAGASQQLLRPPHPNDERLKPSTKANCFHSIKNDHHCWGRRLSNNSIPATNHFSQSLLKPAWLRRVICVEQSNLCELDSGVKGIGKNISNFLATPYPATTCYKPTAGEPWNSLQESHRNLACVSLTWRPIVSVHGSSASGSFPKLFNDLWKCPVYS